jgi:hypothetical protein
VLEVFENRALRETIEPEREKGTKWERQIT